MFKLEISQKESNNKNSLKNKKELLEDR